MEPVSLEQSNESLLSKLSWELRDNRRTIVRFRVKVGKNSGEKRKKGFETVPAIWFSAD